MLTAYRPARRRYDTTMSCIGIDIGQANAVVAIARRGGIDVLSNEVSSRLSACMGKPRHSAPPAAALRGRI